MFVWGLGQTNCGKGWKSFRDDSIACQKNLIERRKICCVRVGEVGKALCSRDGVTAAALRHASFFFFSMVLHQQFLGDAPNRFSASQSISRLSQCPPRDGLKCPLTCQPKMKTGGRMSRRRRCLENRTP